MAVAESNQSAASLVMGNYYLHGIRYKLFGMRVNKRQVGMAESNQSAASLVMGDHYLHGIR